MTRARARNTVGANGSRRANVPSSKGNDGLKGCCEYAARTCKREEEGSTEPE